MKRITEIISLIIISFSLVSCQEDEKIIVPAVEIAAANTGSTTLSFYVAHAGATSGAYLCLPEGKALPTNAVEVFGNGIAMDMDKQEIAISGLNPNTSYNIVVAVENEHRNAISNSINMTTSILVPSIASVHKEKVSLTSLSFTIEYKNVTSGAYLCIPKGESIPTKATDVLSQGIPFSINGNKTTIIVNDLEPGTEYTILVAVANEYTTRMSTPYTITLPVAEKPTITINKKEITNSSFTFTSSVNNAQEAAWFVLPADEKAPTTNNIFENGKSLAINSPEEMIIVDNLEQGKEYVLYAAAKNYNQETCCTLNFKIIKGDFLFEFDTATYKTYRDTNRELILYDGSKDNPNHKLILDLHFNAGNVTIPTGTYEVKGGTMYGTACTWYSEFIIAEENTTFKLSNGIVNISVTKKGVYTIDIDIILTDGRNLATTFVGTISEE